MATRIGSRAARNSRRRLSSPAKAVMKAFGSARISAPQFLSACGIFPEVSESASDGLHRIVNELATSELDKGKYSRALQRRMRQLASARTRPPSTRELLDQIGADLTALLASEATAAYLFGLCVGLHVRSLPKRIERI